METVLVQINDAKAYKILEDLEALQLIKILMRKEPLKQKTAAEDYTIELPCGLTSDLQNYLEQSRKEWNTGS